MISGTVRSMREGGNPAIGNQLSHFTYNVRSSAQLVGNVCPSKWGLTGKNDDEQKWQSCCDYLL